LVAPCTSLRYHLSLMSVSDLAVRNLNKLYGYAQKTGLMEKPWCKRAFIRSYFFYKRILEDPFYGLSRVRPELFQGGHILDVGANIGYTAATFGSVIDPGYSVFCFEPDMENLEHLRTYRALSKFEEVLVPVHSAIGAEEGQISFWHNSTHSGDHRVITDEFRGQIDSQDHVTSVPLTSIDGYLRANEIHEPISFIKIDVQGYELPVCEGMVETLEKNPELTIAAEYCPEVLIDLGYVPLSLVHFFTERGYALFLMKKSGTLKKISPDHFELLVGKRGYIDFLASKKDLLR